MPNERPDPRQPPPGPPPGPWERRPHHPDYQHLPPPESGKGFNWRLFFTLITVLLLGCIFLVLLGKFAGSIVAFLSSMDDLVTASDPGSRFEGMIALTFVVVVTIVVVRMIKRG